MFARNIVLEIGTDEAYSGVRGDKDADVYKCVTEYENGAVYTLTRYIDNRVCHNLQLPVSAFSTDGRYLFHLACFPECEGGGAEQFLNKIYAVLRFLVPDFDAFYLNIPTFGNMVMQARKEGVNGSS